MKSISFIVNSVHKHESTNSTKCKCGGEVRNWTVKKDGENKGRTFKRCNKCKYFEWTSPGSEDFVASESWGFDYVNCDRCTHHVRVQVSRQYNSWEKTFYNCPNCKFFSWNTTY